KLANSSDGSLRRIGGSRGDFVDRDRSRVVVHVDQVGEGSADVDSESLHATLLGLEDDLAEVLTALHDLHRLPRLAEREDLVHERLYQSACRQVEHLLDLPAIVDERADHLLLRAEEGDDVEGDDLAGMAAADHQAAVLRQGVESLLEELAADVLEHEVDA